jgi:glutamyl-tRNA synthetase
MASDLMADSPMRVRFAPSPTGSLHIGGARTALYNWLPARHEHGTLVLRIEDTDAERSTPENVAQILDSLQWLQLDYDEGPFMQTDRTARHQEVLAMLLDAGHAYRSNATGDDVAAYKAVHGADRGFRGTAEEAGAVRLRVPSDGATVVHDVIRGDTTFEHIHLDDPVIARADGSVLYNFAVAIDDLDSAITHVVRGEDHLSNTPKQLLVLGAVAQLGLTGGRPLPVYAHLPLLHGPDGKKLSKRHGAASVGELRSAGYLPAAIRNYLALLGWGAGDDETVLSTPELVQRFTLERVSRNPARFDETKLRWLNGVHIRRLDTASLSGLVREFLLTEASLDPSILDAHAGLLEAAVAISQEKIHTLADFWPLASFLFGDPSFQEKAVAKWLDASGVELLGATRDALAGLEDFDVNAVQGALEALVNDRLVKPGAVYQPLRVAISGSTVSPGIFESVALLGRKRTLARIDAACALRQ